MVKPEKRWQLLLVADDGRIVPFKRIKGVAVGVVILLVLLGLFCAGLAWQLTAEKVRHHRTQEQLADADRQITHYKREHELIAAELVLAEARMEKAGLPVPRRKERIAPSHTASAANDETAAGAASDEAAAASSEAPPAEAAASLQPAAPAPASPEPVAADAPVDEPAPSPAPPAEKPSVVDLGDLEMAHDIDKQTLMARFRVSNENARSSPIAGHCVVVLKSEQLDRDAWQAMPDVPMTEGVPDGERGRSFRISRFIDLEIIAPVQRDPSAFTTASVYVFDASGAVLLTRDFAIDLPGPAPEPSVDGDDRSESGVDGGPADRKAPVAVDGLKLAHDAEKDVLSARFRVSNTGSSSDPVAGRCVVVLHGPQLDTDAWLVMPGVDMVDGEPDGARGQAFQISRFKDMEVKAMGQADPSSFTLASIYVFDTAGRKLLQKDFPIDLPAPEPAAAPAADATEAPDASSPSSNAAPADQPANTTPPSGDDVKPAEKPDSRARF
ncbi:MAG TPA: hypothetical protein VLT88_14005 [Desulfosarcina sp.]|nr:hypothetical protein [Desulfosarcina sp.]